MNKPKISIVTITYNSERYIEETIQSVLKQQYEPMEYIIVDGASTDRTLEIIKKYSEQISVIISEKDNGISDAFNKGIKIATGEIIGIINSDDLLEEGALNEVANAYDESIDVYSGNLIIWNDQTNTCTVQSPEINFRRLKVQYNVAHPARFIRKAAYEKWGYYSCDLKYKMDIDLLVRFAHAGAKFIHIDKSLARFRLGGTTSHSIWKKRNDFYQFIKRNGWSNFHFYIVWIIYSIRFSLKLLANKIKYE